MQVEMLHICGMSDCLAARQRGREVARDMGFSLVDQTIIAYTISEFAQKLIACSKQGHMVIRAIGRSKGEPAKGIEVRFYDHFRGMSRMNPTWAEKLVDDVDITIDRLRGTMVMFRKWLLAPLPIDKPICAAGEE